MTITRTWAMPNKETFKIKPIEIFVRKYLEESSISIDPFARNCTWATYTNDINPSTQAQYHMDATEFLEILLARGVKAELGIFDPPYSLEQLKRSYNSVGRLQSLEDGWKPNRWTREKNLMGKILEVGGIFLQCGWSSQGMGNKRGFELLEILLVCHGTGHNDTICIAERKIQNSLDLR